MQALRMNARMLAESTATGEIHFGEDSIVELNIQSIQIPTLKDWEDNKDLIVYPGGKWWVADNVNEGESVKYSGDELNHVGKTVLQNGKVRVVPDRYQAGVRPLLKVTNLMDLQIYEGECLVLGDIRVFHVVSDDTIICGENICESSFMLTDENHNIKNSEVLKRAKEWVVNNQKIKF